MNASVDHLVVHADNLAQGEAWARATLGVTALAGGAHPGMGTHNLLLRVSETVYLEIIAIDPHAPSPPRPRWFELDDPQRRARAAQSPRLIHFVARCPDLSATVLGAKHNAGRVVAMQRGPYRWSISVPDDGALPVGGLVPTLIEWHTQPPVGALPQTAARLTGLCVRHPEPAQIGALHRCLGLQGVELEAAATPTLAARFSTPLGVRTLESDTPAASR